MKDRETALSPAVFDDEAFRVYFWRQSVDAWWWRQDEGINLNAPDGSWAQVQEGTVTAIGPRDLWAEAENAHRRWQTAGQPELSEWTVQVTPSGQTVIALPH